MNTQTNELNQRITSLAEVVILTLLPGKTKQKIIAEILTKIIKPCKILLCIK